MHRLHVLFLTQHFCNMSAVKMILRTLPILRGASNRKNFKSLLWNVSLTYNKYLGPKYVSRYSIFYLRFKTIAEGWSFMCNQPIQNQLEGLCVLFSIMQMIRKVQLQTAVKTMAWFCVMPCFCVWLKSPVIRGSLLNTLACGWDSGDEAEDLMN